MEDELIIAVSTFPVLYEPSLKCREKDAWAAVTEIDIMGGVLEHWEQ